MFGIIRRRKPIIFAHWYVPLLDFQSDTEQFYQAIESELRQRQFPGLSLERIDFFQSSMLSARRTYLRLRHERQVVDICSAPFGTGWWFSARVAVLPRILRVWELVVFILSLVSFFAIYWHLFGMMIGSICFGSSIALLILTFLAANNWASLDEFLITLPVVGALYEGVFRRDSYHRQDQRLVLAAILNTVIRAKVTEFCAAGEIDNPEFIQVSSPDQILTVKELAYFQGLPEKTE